MTDIERIILWFSGVKNCVTMIISDKDCEIIIQALQEKQEREKECAGCRCEDRANEDHPCNRCGLLYTSKFKPKEATND